MCGPIVPWDWLVLDVSYVMILVGGGMTLRVRGAMPHTWLFFALLSIAVGGFLFAGTVAANPAMDYASQTTAMEALKGC